MPAKSARDVSPASSVDPLDCIDLDSDHAPLPPVRPIITPKRPVPTPRRSTVERSQQKEKRRRTTTSLDSGDDDVKPRPADLVSHSSSKGRTAQRSQTKSGSGSPVKRKPQPIQTPYRSSDLPSESPSPPPAHIPRLSRQVSDDSDTFNLDMTRDFDNSRIEPGEQTPFDLVPPGDQDVKPMSDERVDVEKDAHGELDIPARQTALLDDTPVPDVEPLSEEESEKIDERLFPDIEIKIETSETSHTSSLDNGARNEGLDSHHPDDQRSQHAGDIASGETTTAVTGGANSSSGPTEEDLLETPLEGLAGTAADPVEEEEEGGPRNRDPASSELQDAEAPKISNTVDDQPMMTPEVLELEESKAPVINDDAVDEHCTVTTVEGQLPDGVLADAGNDPEGEAVDKSQQVNGTITVNPDEEHINRVEVDMSSNREALGPDTSGTASQVKDDTVNQSQTVVDESIGVHEAVDPSPDQRPYDRKDTPLQEDVMDVDGPAATLPDDRTMDIDATPSSPAAQNMDVEGEDEIDPDEGMDIDGINDEVTESTPLPSVDTPQATSSAPSPSKTPKVSASKPKASVKSKPTSTKGATKKGTKPKGKTKVEDLKASASASSPVKARSASVSESAGPSTPASEPPVQTPPASENAEELFCLCRKVFDEDDEEGVMVGCDGCNDWFHPSCIGMSEDEVKLIDVYICAQCEQRTSQRTAYRRVCKRDVCEKSVGARVSKYCSSTCAFQHMAEQIPPTMSNKLLKQMTAAFVGLPRPPTRFQTTHHLPETPKIPTVDIASALQAQLDAINNALRLLNQRQKILEQAIARCEPSGGAQANAVAVKAAKPKKGSRPATEDRSCGWTQRLLWSDEEVLVWDGTGFADDRPGEEAVDEAVTAREDFCLNPRRRCDRHQGWQKTIPVTLDLQQAQLDRRKAAIEEQIEQNTQNQERERAEEAARDNIRTQLGVKPFAIVVGN